MAAGRRLTGAAELPVTGAVVLALLALIQVTGGAASSGPAEPVLGGDLALVDQGPPTFALLLGLLATAPLAFVRPHLVPVAVTVTAANALTLARIRPPPSPESSRSSWCSTWSRGSARTRAGCCLLLPFAVSWLFRWRAVGGHEARSPVCSTLATLAGGRREHGSLPDRVGGTAESEEYLAGSLLEHTARGERARIARELHDVVAHHISMIAVQAETARLTDAGHAARGRQAALAIGDTARTALTEMRRLLGVLREDAGDRRRDAGGPQPGLRPAQRPARRGPGRQRRQHPADRARAGRSPLDPGVELAAYRIVQEALTNVAPARAGRGRRRRAATTPTTRCTCGSATTARARRPVGDGHRRARAARHARARRHGRRPAHGRPGTGGGFLVEAVLPTRDRAMTP